MTKCKACDHIPVKLLVTWNENAVSVVYHSGVLFLTYLTTALPPTIATRCPLQNPAPGISYSGRVHFCVCVCPRADERQVVRPLSSALSQHTLTQWLCEVLH